MYTQVSPILQCVGSCNLFGFVWSMFVYNSRTRNKPMCLYRTGEGAAICEGCIYRSTPSDRNTNNTNTL